MNSIDRLPPWAARLLREPLFHFVVLGACIFAADTALTRLRGNEREIVVPAQARQEAHNAFVAKARRDPSEAEMRQFMARWIDNEILYREGLSLGLDKGDPAMRDRVIFKALNVVQAGVVLPRADEAVLRAWFDRNHARYDLPARISFDEAVPSADATPEALQKFVAALNGEGTPEIESSLRVFKDRPQGTVTQAYGAAFAQQLVQQKPGRWAALASTGGLRAVRLDSQTEGRLLAFEDVRDRVFQDWKDETSAALTTEAVRKLGQRYRIVLGGQP